MKTDYSQWKDDPSTHKGIPSSLQELPAPEIIRGQDGDGDWAEILVPDVFEPGSIMLFATDMKEMPKDLDDTCKSGADEAFGELDLIDLNCILHRADGEERDATGGDGTYSISNFGSLVYCGLEGWMNPLRQVMEHNDLGHPLAAHLRDGTWAMDYVHDRIQK